MAKIYSPIVEVGSGSVGGITFTRTREHQVVMRQRTVPVNPNTPAQQSVRNGLAQAATQWETTTEEKRVGWAEYALTLTWYTKLGNAFVPTGRQAFMQIVALTAFLTNQGLIAQPPDAIAGEEPGSFSVPMPEVENLLGVGIGFQLKFANENPHNVLYYIRRAPKISNGTNFFKGPYDPSTAGIITVVSEDTEIFGFDGLVDGARYPWIARPFTTAFQTHAFRVAPILSGIATARETV